MAARALWSGSISFGLVNIPVKLVSAAKERALKFRMLAKDDLCPISYKKVCREDDKTVTQDEIVKGYEVEKGKYVVLEPEDFKRASAKKTELIDIVSFSDERDIDTKLFDKPYYVEPEKKSAKAYALLRDALAKSGKVGVAKFVMRDKEHLGVLRPDGKILILDQLRYLDEIRDPEEVTLPAKADYSKKEFDLAMTLIDSQTEAFDPKDYKDTYTDELWKVIKAKAKGKLERIKEPEGVEPTDVTDILEMLKKSLDEKPRSQAHAHAR
jgi:DNA end-binding protein Ku